MRESAHSYRRLPTTREDLPPGFRCGPAILHIEDRIAELIETQQVDPGHLSTILADSCQRAVQGEGPAAHDDEFGFYSFLVSLPSGAVARIHNYFLVESTRVCPGEVIPPH